MSCKTSSNPKFEEILKKGRNEFASEMKSQSQIDLRSRGVNKIWYYYSWKKAYTKDETKGKESILRTICFQHRPTRGQTQTKIGTLLHRSFHQWKCYSCKWIRSNFLTMAYRNRYFLDSLAYFVTVPVLYKIKVNFVSGVDSLVGN